MTEELLALTGDIVIAHVSHNDVAAADLPALIGSIYASLQALSAPIAVEAPVPQPAVSIRASVKPDHLVCLEDGKKVTLLKPYLRSRFGMTPDDYRAKWGLARDYPMVAPDYAARRRDIAKSMGLGTPEAARPAKPVRKKLGIAVGRDR